MEIAVGDSRSIADAIVLDRLQPGALVPRRAAVLVDDDAGDGLSAALAHDPGLGLVQRDAFVPNDGRRSDTEAVDSVRKCRVSREGQIIGIASRMIRPAPRLQR